MKRPITIVGGILGVIAQSILSIIMMIASAMMITEWALMVEAQVFDELQMVVPGLVFVLIFTVLTLVTLLMNAIALSSWKKDKAGYKKRKGFIITAIVLNFILLLFIIITISANGFMPDIIPFIFLMGLVIASNVLYIVDLAREKNKVEPEVEVSSDKEVLSTKETEVFVYEIEKVYALKKKGLLSDDDYKTLKKHYIKNFTN